MQSVTFFVPGKPQGKPRARTVFNRKLGHNVSYTPEKGMLYENLIKSMYLAEAGDRSIDRATPVTLRIIARFLPPKSTSRKKCLDMLEGRLYPLKKPDMDNIVKVVADALNGVAYHDDTQVVKIVAKKAYSAVEGVHITVEEYTE